MANDDTTTLRKAFFDLLSSIEKAGSKFWGDVISWLGGLRPAYKAALIAGGYLAADVLTGVTRGLLSRVSSRLSSALLGVDFTLTGIDFLFMIVYLQVVTMVFIYYVMRSINRLRDEVDSMGSEQARLDGGTASRYDDPEPLIDRILSTRAFWFSIIGFGLGLPFGFEQAFTLAITAGFAGLLFPSD